MAKNARLIDMTGQRHGKWTVIEQAGNTAGGGALWLSRCDCGTERAVIGADLRQGKSVSCGCEGSRTRIGSRARTHGASGTRLHHTWKNMRRRCADQEDPDYGGRGITVCEAWGSFETFRAWASTSGYQPHLTIERLDVNGGYEPQNCIWADAQAQSENRRFVAKAPNGRLWLHIARDNGISDAAYRSRLDDGWDYHEAATWPMGKRRRDGNLKRANYLQLDGEAVPATIAAKRLGYSPAALYQRAKRSGITLQEALDQMASLGTSRATRWRPPGRDTSEARSLRARG